MNDMTSHTILKMEIKQSRIFTILLTN